MIDSQPNEAPPDRDSHNQFVCLDDDGIPVCEKLMVVEQGFPAGNLGEEDSHRTFRLFCSALSVGSELMELTGAPGVYACSLRKPACACHNDAVERYKRFRSKFKPEGLPEWKPPEEK